MNENEIFPSFFDQCDHSDKFPFNFEPIGIVLPWFKIEKKTS